MPLPQTIMLVLGLAIGGSPVSAGSLFVSASGPPHRFFGLLQSAHGAALTLRLRSGRLLNVDASRAFAAARVAEPLFAGKSTVVEGTFGRNGIFQAQAVKRASLSPAAWGQDR